MVSGRINTHDFQICFVHHLERLSSIIPLFRRACNTSACRSAVTFELVIEREKIVNIVIVIGDRTDKGPQLFDIARLLKG
jgi:hypothetical protein